MPIYISSSGYGYTYKTIKKPKTSKKKVFKFLVVFLLLLIIITSIILLVKNISFTKKETVTLYAVEIMNSSDLNYAQQFSLSIKNQGGAGYVYFKNNTYQVLASCYKNKEDAEKISSSLNENGYQTTVQELVFNEINIKNTNKTEKELINNALKLFIDNYSYLYDVSVLYDTNQLSLNEYKSKINELYSQNEKNINEINNYFYTTNNSQIIYLKIYLNNLQQIINDLKNNTKNTSSFIKESYFKVIFLYDEMRQNI